MAMIRRIAIAMTTLALAFTMPHAFAAKDSRAALMAEAKVTEAQAKATAWRRFHAASSKAQSWRENTVD
jgi:hypothetical protein